MTLHCPTCGRITIPGLSPTQETIILRLSASHLPMTANDLWRGLTTDVSSAAVQLSYLRKRIKPHGLTITINKGGRGNQAAYSLAPVSGDRA